MKVFLRINSFFQMFVKKYYYFIFAEQCQHFGKGLKVNGPFRFRNNGMIEIGRSCIFDSSKERPIRLDIGCNAVLILGDGVYLNEGVNIVCNIAVTIGHRCLIASDVVIMDDDGHPVDWKERHNHWPVVPQDRLGAPIIIENNVWIGTRSIILKGVTIGEGSVVGAGSVVTHSIPPRTLVAGIPARVIRDLN